jgi:hypothetical protein
MNVTKKHYLQEGRLLHEVEVRFVVVLCTVAQLPRLLVLADIVARRRQNDAQTLARTVTTQIFVTQLVSQRRRQLL